MEEVIDATWFWFWLKLAGAAVLLGGGFSLAALKLPPRQRLWLVLIVCPLLAFWPLGLAFLRHMP